MSLVPSIFSAFSLYGESTSYVLSFQMVFFRYLVTTGWIFDISLLCENSMNQSSINKQSQLFLLLLFRLLVGGGRALRSFTEATSISIDSKQLRYQLISIDIKLLYRRKRWIGLKLRITQDGAAPFFYRSISSKIVVLTSAPKARYFCCFSHAACCLLNTGGPGINIIFYEMAIYPHRWGISLFTPPPGSRVRRLGWSQYMHECVGTSQGYHGVYRAAQMVLSRYCHLLVTVHA